MDLRAREGRQSESTHTCLYYILKRAARVKVASTLKKDRTTSRISFSRSGGFYERVHREICPLHPQVRLTPRATPRVPCNKIFRMLSKNVLENNYENDVSRIYGARIRMQNVIVVGSSLPTVDPSRIERRAFASGECNNVYSCMCINAQIFFFFPPFSMNYRRGDAFAPCGAA